MRRLRSSLSYANVASSIALFLAVSGGTAIAAATIGTSDIQSSAVTKPKIARNAITASKINNGAVSGRDVRDESLDGADIANGSLTGDDVRDASLGGADIRAGSIGVDQLAPDARPGANAGGPAAQGVVSASGALVRGSGVANVSMTSPGIYVVTFTRDVSTCTPVATLGGQLEPNDEDGRVGGGTVSIAPSGASNATLIYEVRNLAGVDTPRPFSFIVQC